MAWDDLTTTYTLRNARIVAALDDGGAVVDTCDIDYVEGRFATEVGEDDRPPFLEPEFTFHSTGRDDPIAVAMTEARIVIDGVTDDGPLEIRGNGYFGYDENGQIEGRFIEQPAMLLDALPEYPRSAANDEDEATFQRVEPAQPPQYVRACRRYEPIG